MSEYCIFPCFGFQKKEFTNAGLHNHIAFLFSKQC